MSATFKRLGQSELLPRYVFAEALYARRRVLELGAVASTGGESAAFLLGRGARQVVAADADLAAVQAAQLRHAVPGLRFRAMAFDDFETGAFDLILVADLAPYVRAPENLKELKRLLARSGALMGGLRNPAGLSLASIIDPDDGEAPPTYGQLLDALSTFFPSVEVATQSPVLGYQLAFDRGEGLQVDGSLAGTSEAAYYVVLAAEEPVRSFDPTWVQLPPEPLAFNGAKLEDAALRARDWRQRADTLKEALGRRTVELEDQQGALQQTREQLDAAREAASRLTAQLETAREAPETLRAREELATRVHSLQVELERAQGRASDAEARVAQAQAQQEAQAHLSRDAAVAALAAQEQARLERARREELTTQLEEARTRLGDARERLQGSADDAGAARVEGQRAAHELEALQAALAARDARLEEARQRELQLADQRTEALTALELVQARLDAATRELAQARAEAASREAEGLSAVRALEADAVARQQQQAELESLRAQAAGLAAELAAREAAEAGRATELQAMAAAHQRALRDAETVASSERHWRELASQYEERLSGATQDIQQLNDQLAQLEGARGAEVARLRRLELDLATTVTAGRTAQEQAEAALAEAHRRQAAMEAEASVAVEALATSRAEVAAMGARLDGATQALAGELTAFSTREQELQALLERQVTTSLEAERRAQEHATQRKLLDERAVDLEAQVRRLHSDLEVATGRLAEVTAQLEAQRAAGVEAAGQLTRLADADARATSLAGELEVLRQLLEEGAVLTATRALELESLRLELSGALGARAEIEAALQEARAHLATATSQLAERAETLELERAARARADEALTGAQAQLRHANAELVHLARSIDEQGAGLEARGRQALELDARLQLLEQEKRQLAESLALAMSEVAHLAAELQESQAARQAERDAAEGQLAQGQAETARAAAEAQHRLAALERELTEARAAARSARLESQRDPEVGRLRARLERLEAVSARQPELESQLASQGALVTELQAELEVRQRHLLELETALVAPGSLGGGASPSPRDALLVEAEERAVRAEVEVSTLQTRVGALELELAETLEPLERRDEELAVARRRLSQAEAELEGVRARAAGEQGAERTARLQAEEHLVTLRARYGELKQQQDASARALTEGRAERERLEHERLRLAGQLEELPRLRAEVLTLKVDLMSARRPSGSSPSRPGLASPVPAVPVQPPVPSGEPGVFDLDVEVPGEADEILWTDDDEPGPFRPRS